MNRTFKPERQKFQTLITWKLLIRSWRNFNREYAPRVCLRGWSRGSPNKSKMAAAAIFNFGKMSITLHWIVIIQISNFMERCITAMRRWPGDQKSKPEVNLRGVIKWRSEAYVRRSQWLSRIIWTKFYTELKHHTTDMKECANFTRLENPRRWRPPSWISENVNNSELDRELFAQNLVGRFITAMRRWHMTKTRNRNFFCVTSLLWWIKTYIIYIDRMSGT